MNQEQKGQLIMTLIAILILAGSIYYAYRLLDALQRMANCMCKQKGNYEIN